MSKRIAVVLSGCGHSDGTEITEAVSTIIALSEFNAKVTYFAPNLQFTPKNPKSGDSHPSDVRSIMVEASRITREPVMDLKSLHEKDFDGLIIPGGYGSALHLCNWATQGSSCDVLPELVTAIKAFHSASKPIGAICIAPVIIAKVLGNTGVTLTVGKNPEIQAEVLKTGANPIDCPPDDFITDRLHKVITTPAYMYDTKPHIVFKGIKGLVAELVEMA